MARRRTTQRRIPGPVGSITITYPKKLREDGEAMADIQGRGMVETLAVLADQVRHRVSQEKRTASGRPSPGHLVSGGLWQSLSVRARSKDKAGTMFRGSSLPGWYSRPPLKGEELKESADARAEAWAKKLVKMGVDPQQARKAGDSLRDKINAGKANDKPRKKPKKVRNRIKANRAQFSEGTPNEAILEPSNRETESVLRALQMQLAKNLESSADVQRVTGDRLAQQLARALNR